MSYTTTAFINLSALQHNLQQVKKLAPGRRIVAMVKANAYGHGLVTIAHALQHQVDALGVARIHEALALRRAGIQGRIVLMEGFFEAWELPLIVQHQFDVVVHQQSQVDMLLASHLKTPVHVWLKLDTGMHRLGFQPQDFIAVWHQLHEHPEIASEIILMTHFSSADDLTVDITQKQMQCFEEVTQQLTGPRSLANSAAIVAFPQSHADWVRPGLMLYGISPFADKTAAELNLKPVMTLTSRLLAIQNLPANATIGYSAAFTCPENMPVGLAAVGYGDGYPRYIPVSGAPVIVNGELTQIIGLVSMDMLHIDLRKCKTPSIGDQVVLWGQGLPVETIAKAAHTSPYELLCGVTSRVEMRIVS